MSSAPGVRMPWFSKSVVLPEQAADFPRLVARFASPEQITGTPCAGPLPQTGACTGAAAFSPGCAGTALPADCGWREVRGRRLTLAPTTRAAAARLTRFVMKGSAPLRKTATMTWFTTYDWKVAFVPCEPSWCRGALPNPDPEAMRNPGQIRFRLHLRKASQAVVFVGIRSRARFRKGRLTLYAVGDKGAAGARLGGAPFRIPAGGTSGSAVVTLTPAAQQQLRQTGELPVIARTRIDGGVPVRKQVVVRMAIPTVIAGRGGPDALMSGSALVLGGIVSHAPSVTYRFEYGPTTAYGMRTPDQTRTQRAMSVSATIADLAPGETYHFRLVATTVNGTTAGPDGTFTMPATPVEPPLADDPDAP